MYVSRLCRLITLVNNELNGICSCLARRSATSTNVGDGPPLSSELKSFSEVPGPGGLYRIPYIGAALFFKPFTKYQPTEINELVNSLKDKYGDIFKMRFGMDYIVYVNHPDYAKTLLQANYEEHRRPPFDLSLTFFKRTGNKKGMILLNGEEWAQRRKPTQEKMMRPAVVAMYVPLIEKVTNDFVELLRKKGKVDDLLSVMSNYTTESVGMLCFNKRLGCMESGVENTAASAVRNVLEILQNTFFMPSKTYLYFRTKLYRQFESEMLKFKVFVDKEIASQRAFLTKLEKEGKLEEYLETEPNFMHSLLSDGRLSDDSIASVIQDLFGAGIDSTAYTMVFLLMELAINQDKQAKLYEEIQRVVGNSPNLTKEHLAQMSYLKACLRESHRKTFPISFGVVRILESDLAIGGYLLPKNTLMAANMRSMTFDERFFPKPKEFIPERWLRDTTGELAKGKQYPFATKPFGFGPRSCIGQRFAENEIFIGVTKIIQNFEISMPPGASKEVKTTLKIFTAPVGKVELILKERQKK